MRKFPNQDELRKIFNAGGSRERTACALVAFMGVRIGVLGNYTGNDGLKIKDIEGLKIEEGKVTFEKITAMIRVRKELSKTGKLHFKILRL